MSYRDEDQDLFNDPHKSVTEARGILSALWRQLLVVLGIDSWRWDKLMRKYLADPRNGIQNNSRDRSSARGNLNKELKRDDMTWRVFLKAMSFLDPVRVVFTIRITIQDGRTFNVTAKLKDRGPIPPEGYDGSVPERDLNGTDIDPLDQLDELSTTEHRPRRPFTPEDLISAMRGNRDRH
jgi:hypothetical protein